MHRHSEKCNSGQEKPTTVEKERAMKRKPANPREPAKEDGTSFQTNRVLFHSGFWLSVSLGAGSYCEREPSVPDPGRRLVLAVLLLPPQ